MKMPKLIIWGASGHARVVAEIVRLEARFDLVGFLDDQNPEREGQAFCDSVILGGADRLPALREEGIDIARRTVAKYREAMRIPSSVQRRREKKMASQVQL